MNKKDQNVSEKTTTKGRRKFGGNHHRNEGSEQSRQSCHDQGGAKPASSAAVQRGHTLKIIIGSVAPRQEEYGHQQHDESSD